MSGFSKFSEFRAWLGGVQVWANNAMTSNQVVAQAAHFLIPAMIYGWVCAFGAWGSGPLVVASAGIFAFATLKEFVYDVSLLRTLFGWNIGENDSWGDSFEDWAFYQLATILAWLLRGYHLHGFHLN